MIIYILKCEEDKFYVGKTNDIKLSINEHFNGSGSTWTKIYKPIELIEKHESDDDYDEDKFTLKMMGLYGINNVRGGAFMDVNLQKSDIKTINKILFRINKKYHLCDKLNISHGKCFCENEIKKNYLGPYYYCGSNSNSSEYGLPYD